MSKPTNEPLVMGGVLLEPGARIGSYVFMREIGSGGMARVLLAKDPAGELVALKVLRKSRFKTGLVRFRREFRALSRIHHPNVIRVDAYGDLHGHPYIAMEFVDGKDLHELLRGFRAMDAVERWQRCEQILIDLCRALSAIHRRGLVHRDLKPSNVLLARETGACKLTDFGIVKDLDPSHDPTRAATTLVGTWAYASPEQITGNPIDHRSDLYSLGVILFALLTGKRPFVANDMAGYLTLHRDRPAPAPRDIQRDVPEHLDEICRRLLQKAPRDRYQSAQEILYRLEAEERVPAPTPSDGWTPPLVGRTLEVEALTDAVAGLTASRGGVVFLEGDDGCGKSRLMSVAVDRARALGIPHHVARFQPDAPLFAAMIDLAGSALIDLGARAPSRLRTDLESWTAHRPPADGRDATQVVHDAVHEALRQVLDDGPRLWVLDDVHLAHPRELDLLAATIRRVVALDELPLLVIASLRPKANPVADALVSGDEDGSRLGLEPAEMSVGALSREDLTTILVSMVGDSRASRLLAQRLHKETEGNAGFVTEFVRALLARDVIRPRLPGSPHEPDHELTIAAEEVVTGHLEIPIGVRQMLRERVEAIEPADRRVVEVLAVEPRDVDEGVLMDVLDADVEAVLDSLERLIAAGIVRERRVGPSVYYAVVHRKFADVVYRDLDAERRAQLHRRMAAAMELHYANQPAAMEIVGEHYRQAGDAARAYRYLVAAAKRLADRSLMQEAWDLTEIAGTLQDSAMADLLVTEFESFRRDALTVRAAVLDNRAEWADAEKTWQAVHDLARKDDDPRAACEAKLRLALVVRRRNRRVESRELAEEALTTSRQLRFPRGEAQALHHLAALAWDEGDLARCESLAEEGIRVAQSPELASQRAALLLALTAAQATRGSLAEATEGMTEAEGIFRELRQKRQRCVALSNLAELLVLQGDPVQARQRAHMAAELARDLDYRLGRAAALRATAGAALDLGLHRDAEAGYTEAMALAAQIGVDEEVVACRIGLCRLALERGELKRAREHAEHGLELVLDRDPERVRPWLQALLARAVAPLDQTAAERAILEAATALSELPIPRRTEVQLALAWAQLACRAPVAARASADDAQKTASARGFALLAIEARALLASLSEGAEQRTQREVGASLVEQFTAPLSHEMARAFLARPYLVHLAPPEAS